jgi:DNA-directed RNA polymerase beta' subunit
MWSIIDKIPLNFLKKVGIKDSHPRDAMPRMLLVLPPAQRPSLRVADGGKTKGEDDLTLLYQDIIRAALEYEQIHGSPYFTPLEIKEKKKHAPCDLFGKLQLCVSCLVKNSYRSDKKIVIKGVIDHCATRGVLRALRDFDTRLSGKKGRLRGTLGSKRVDFSARTVIGIDMTHHIWQLGVPESRMRVLTFPERVNDLNIEDLRQRILKGNSFGGAANIIQPIQNHDGRMILLTLMTKTERERAANSLQVGWIVERYLKDGDWVIFNRQPTLHRMSMQAFQIYAVKGLTFRLPLPVTRPFNADYDGDEMNLHALQSWDAIAEAQELMSVPFNMVSPSSTGAIISLVQESLVAWYDLTSPNTFLTRDQMCQLISQICFDPNSKYAEWCEDNPSYYLPPPSVNNMWTGKQILSCLLPREIIAPVEEGDTILKGTLINS